MKLYEPNAIMEVPKQVELSVLGIDFEKQTVDFMTPDGTYCTITRNLLEAMAAKFAHLPHNPIEGLSV